MAKLPQLLIDETWYFILRKHHPPASTKSPPRFPPLSRPTKHHPNLPNVPPFYPTKIQGVYKILTPTKYKIYSKETLRSPTFTNKDFLSHLIDNIKTQKVISHYSHDNYIKKSNGKTCLNLDCSGFAYYYFRQMHKLKALQEIRNFVATSKNIPPEDIKRIYCKEYMLFFKHSEPQYWQIINNPKNLCPGDLIVFTSEKTNHCMLVNKILQTQKEKVVIQVIDCSQFPHLNDTRQDGQKGIGQGEITIFHSKENGWNSYKHKLHTYSGMLNLVRAR